MAKKQRPNPAPPVLVKAIKGSDFPLMEAGIAAAEMATDKDGKINVDFYRQLRDKLYGYQKRNDQLAREHHQEARQTVPDTGQEQG
jgi:hypothetical protein